MVYKTENRLVRDFKKSFMSSITSSDGLILLEEVKTNWGIVDILAIRYDSQKLEHRRKIIKGKRIQNFTNITSYAISHIIEKPYLTLEELDRKSTRLNSSHIPLSRMPSSA